MYHKRQQYYFVNLFIISQKYAILILQNILNCCLEGRNYEKTATQSQQNNRSLL